MPTLILFNYENHRGEDHKYLARIGPTSLVFCPVIKPRAEMTIEEKAWHLRAEVLQRDGGERPGFRTFQLSKIRGLEEVADA